MKIKLLLLLIVLLVSQSLFAAEEIYRFDDVKQKQTFNELLSTMRCLVCQNQNLAESNAGLANDLREEIYGQIKRGYSKKEVVDYLVQRYGEFILYQPPLNLNTYFLWFSPVILLLMSVSGLLFYIRKKSDKP